MPEVTNFKLRPIPELTPPVLLEPPCAEDNHYYAELDVTTNFSFLRASARTFRVWHPRGPDKVEVWACIYVDKAAPPDVKEAYRLAGIHTFSPSGTLEQDDMENWQECTRTCEGVVARRYPLNYQMGIGSERRGWPCDWLGDDAVVVPGASENNQRAFYERWQQLMAVG